MFRPRRRDDDHEIYVDDSGVTYTCLHTSDHQDLIRAHPNDCIDVDTCPRLVELRRVGATLTYVDELGRRYLRVSTVHALEPRETITADLLGLPSHRNYSGKDFAFYRLTIGLPYISTNGHHLSSVVDTLPLSTPSLEPIKSSTLGHTFESGCSS